MSRFVCCSAEALDHYKQIASLFSLSIYSITVCAFAVRQVKRVAANFPDLVRVNIMSRNVLDSIIIPFETLNAHFATYCAVCIFVFARSRSTKTLLRILPDNDFGIWVMNSTSRILLC